MAGSSPETAREEIMHATYRALCTHGYADLTTKAIAEESGKSTALLHYYYDTKEDLLVAFLEYLLKRLQEQIIVSEANDDPVTQLTTLVEALLFGQRDDYKDFQTAMLELRAQAPYNPSYREQLRTNDQTFMTLVAEIIERGIDEGVFNDVDPERTARYLTSTIDGARTKWITLDEDDALTDVHQELRVYLSEHLLVDDRRLPSAEQSYRK